MTAEEVAARKQQIAEIVYAMEEERDVRVRTDYRRSITAAMDALMCAVREDLIRAVHRRDVRRAAMEERARRVAGDRLRAVQEDLIRAVAASGAAEDAEAERDLRTASAYRRTVPNEWLEQMMADTREHIRRVGARREVIAAAGAERARRVEGDARRGVHEELQRRCARAHAAEASAAEQSRRLRDPVMLHDRALDQAMADIHTAVARLHAVRSALRASEDEQARRVTEDKLHAVQHDLVRRVNGKVARSAALKEQVERVASGPAVPATDIARSLETVLRDVVRAYHTSAVTAAADAEQVRRVAEANMHSVHDEMLRRAAIVAVTMQALREQKLRMSTDYRRIVPLLMDQLMADCRTEIVRTGGVTHAKAVAENERDRRVARDNILAVGEELERVMNMQAAVAALNAERHRRVRAPRMLRPLLLDQALASVHSDVLRAASTRIAKRAMAKEQDRRVHAHRMHDVHSDVVRAAARASALASMKTEQERRVTAGDAGSHSGSDSDVDTDALAALLSDVRRRHNRSRARTAAALEKDRRIHRDRLWAVNTDVERAHNASVAQHGAEAERSLRCDTDYRRTVTPAMDTALQALQQDVRRSVAVNSVTNAAEDERARRVELDARASVHDELARVAARRAAAVSAELEQHRRVVGPSVLHDKDVDEAMAQVHTAVVRFTAVRAAREAAACEQAERVVRDRMRALLEMLVSSVARKQASAAAAAAREDHVRMYERVQEASGRGCGATARSDLLSELKACTAMA